MSNRMAITYVSAGVIGATILLGGSYALFKMSQPPAAKGVDSGHERENNPSEADIQIVKTDETNPFNKIVCKLASLPGDKTKDLDASAEEHPWKVYYSLAGGSKTPRQLEYDAEKRDGQWQLTPINGEIDPGVYQASVHALLSNGSEVAVSKEQTFTVQQEVEKPVLKITSNREINAQKTRYTFQMQWAPPATPKRSDWKYFVYKRVYSNLSSEKSDANFPAGTTPAPVVGTSKTDTFVAPRDARTRVRYMLEAKSGSLTVRSAIREKDARYHAPALELSASRVVHKSGSNKSGGGKKPHKNKRPKPVERKPYEAPDIEPMPTQDKKDKPEVDTLEGGG